MNEEKLERWADKIYMRYYGHLDNPGLRVAKTQEIFYWLETSDSINTMAEAMSEWYVHDMSEILRLG